MVVDKRETLIAQSSGGRAKIKVKAAADSVVGEDLLQVDNASTWPLTVKVLMKTP